MSNPPAFPTKRYNANIMQMEDMGGMTLRDYFAAKALQGLLLDGVGSLLDEELADWAYKLADAMLNAREA